MRGSIQPGQNVGPFVIVAKLGRGGMATVYSAYETALDREVALKILPLDLLEQPGFAERFEREARLIAKLEHPHIVPLYNYGIDEGVPWMALRLVRGGHLGERMERGALGPETGIAYFSMIADALDHAHELGVIHRDLKPQNVLLGERGEVYLADFGIARLLQGRTLITSTGAVLGTPQYMSPEQAQDGPIGPPADIYALGVMAYLWLSGHLPYDADTPYAVMYKHVNAPLPFAPLEHVPERARQVIARALAKNPEQRWPTATAFVDALAAGLADRDPDTGVDRMAQPGATRVIPSVGAVISGRKLAKVVERERHEISSRQTPVSGRSSPLPAAAPPPGPPPPPPAGPAAAPAPGPDLVFRGRSEPSRASNGSSRRWLAVAITVLALGGLSAMLLFGRGEPGDTATDVAGTDAAATPPAAPASVTASPGVDPEPAAATDTSAAPAAAELGRLLVESDADCQFSLDGVARGILKSGTPLRLELPPGRYQVRCVISGPAGAEGSQAMQVVADEPTVALFELAGQVETKKRLLADEQRRQEELARKAEAERVAAAARAAEQARQRELALQQEAARRQAEEARKLEEARRAAQARAQAEAARQAELVRKAREAEQARLAADARKLEEARRAAEARRLQQARPPAAAPAPVRPATPAAAPANAAAEAARKAEEARKTDAARKAEAARLAEAKRRQEAARRAEQAKRDAEALDRELQAEAAKARAARAAPTPPAAPSAAPVAISTPQPAFPSEALRSGTKGEVVVSITIAPDGRVRWVRILSAKPRGVFDRAVLEAVREWRYQPLPAETKITRTIYFR